ncbi:hypothetical protein V2G26_016584 [Clonostachys chloroleuca]
MPPQTIPDKGQDEPPNTPPPQWVFAAAWALVVMIIILLLLSAIAGDRWQMPGSFEIDPETGISWSNVDHSNEDLDQLDAVAPEESYEKLRDEVEHCQEGDHLAWPDSFYECIVCLDCMKAGQTVRRLPCGHIFHSQCIIPWYLRRHYSCPLCLHEYIPEDE